MSSLRLLVLCALSGVLLAGCFGGQTGQEDRTEHPADCAFQRAALQPAEATSLGFTAVELEAELASSTRWRIQWARMATSSELTLAVREVRARTLSVSTNGDCADAIELDVLLAMSSADGMLDEAIAATVSAQALATWSLNGEVAFDALEGELDASDLDLDLSNWRAPRLSLRIWGGSDMHGQISLDGEDPSPDDDRAPTSASIAELSGL